MTPVSHPSSRCTSFSFPGMSISCGRSVAKADAGCAVPRQGGVFLPCEVDAEIIPGITLVPEEELGCVVWPVIRQEGHDLPVSTSRCSTNANLGSLKFILKTRRSLIRLDRCGALCSVGGFVQRHAWNLPPRAGKDSDGSSPRTDD